MKKLLLLLLLTTSLSVKAQYFGNYDFSDGYNGRTYHAFNEFLPQVDISREKDTSYFRYLIDTVYIKNSPITQSFIANWNTSFSWGNHATHGYLDTEAARTSISFTDTGIIDFDLTALSYQDFNITVIGVENGDAVSIGVPNGAVVADVTYFGWVSAVNTVTIRCSRVGGGGAANPPSGTFRASIFRY